MAPTPLRRPRSDRERDLLARAARLLPSAARNPAMSPEYALIVREARGARITDESGNEYIDYLLGSGPMLLGHAHPAVVAAVRGWLEKGASYLLVSEPAVALAEKLVRHVPGAERVCFASSGSEAVAYALRLARAARGRDRILKFEGGYHGQADCVLMSNQWTREPAPFPAPVPNSLGVPRSAAGDVLVAPFNDGAAAAELIDRHQGELAAVLVEPMQRTLPPRPGFLEGLREATRRRGIPLVFDEVVTGFRLGLGGAAAYYGVTPDLCALGKSISGGLPFAAVCGSAELLAFAEASRQLTGGYVSLTGTYSGNPLSCVAALAAIAELEREGVYDALFARGRRLWDGIERRFAAAGIPVRVSGEAPAFQVWFTGAELVDFRSTLACDARRGMRFTGLLLERGVMKAHEKFFLSTAHGDDEIDQTLAACDDAIQALAAGA